MVMSHAPGLSGTPVSGQRSSAATRASCARSSARPTSPTIRAMPAISRADSTRQTASIVRRTSGVVMRRSACVTCTCREFPFGEGPMGPLERGPPLLLARQRERPEPVPRRARLEILQVVELADLDLAVLHRRVREATRPLHRLLAGPDLDDRVPRDQLLGLGERSVHGRGPAAGPDDAPAPGAGME